MDWWRSAVELMVPRQCVGCERFGTWLCAECLAAGTRRARARRTPAGQVVWAATRYESVAGRVVVAHKERGIRSLTDTLAAWLGSAVRAGGAGFDAVLVPVPPSRAGRLRRGDDPWLRTCRVLAAGTGMRVAPVLGWRGRWGAQKAHGRQGRLAGVEGKLSVAARAAERVHLPGAQVVVVDDVLTTGATLDAARAALVRLGCQTSAAVVCAAGPDPPPGGATGGRRQGLGGPFGVPRSG